MGKVVVKFDIREMLGNIFDSATVTNVGTILVEESKRFIGTGTSPVLGEGKFEPYKAVTAGKHLRVSAASQKGYPYSVLKLFPDKTISPVNLSLTGDMLRALNFRQSGKSMEFGIFKANADQKVIDRAQANNEGTDRLPARPFIPNQDGQEFNASIMRLVIDAVTLRIADLILESNDK